MLDIGVHDDVKRARVRRDFQHKTTMQTGRERARVGQRKPVATPMRMRARCDAERVGCFATSESSARVYSRARAHHMGLEKRGGTLMAGKENNNLRLGQIDQGIRADDLTEGGRRGREASERWFSARLEPLMSRPAAKTERHHSAVQGRDLFTQQEWGMWQIGPMIG
ncbi:hypothetical protein N7492_001465 [Penicillium capsulatum]|uniref:Uncharacterized protein n=1 Tax=Penicillium capsulatum TaxID=69766 RepID=A0A9W9M0C0_9EURO|nr:hypothetical protein N7492_001465 [Penicillium capsulatum]KAJ6129481.1 hypothetical protein N7512_002261 [Penicillium capsulatum]